eukprot:TRINITY_DN4438_c0_g1_i1.p1 TRINITY_DN4438_c0_g1~~TRINITY_DN4438_c0_g1_i1.p1  ORF type:complete len:700 (+),score=145.14 TRINITY_DN4438_c0_g1_i1:41-2140(+)
MTEFPTTVSGFHDAIKRCDLEMVEGVDVKVLNASDEHGFTGLMWAAWLGHVEIGEALLEIGADIKAQDSDGQDALYHACWQGEGKFVNLLLEKGADPNSLDIDGETPLMAAAHHGCVETIQSLLKKEASISIKDRNGMCAYDHCIKWGHQEKIGSLLKQEDSHVKEMTRRFNEMGKEDPIEIHVHHLRRDTGTSSSSSPGVSAEEKTITTATSTPNVEPQWIEVDMESSVERSSSVARSGSSDSCNSAHSCISINLWKRRGFSPLQIDTDPEFDDDEEELPPSEIDIAEDVRRFLDSFPSPATACTVCEDESGDLLSCTECDEVLCPTCWKNEHQNKKRRGHVGKPTQQESRLEVVAQVAVQLSRVLEKTETERDTMAHELHKRHEVQTALVQDLHSERMKRAQLESELMRMQERQREMTDLIHRRDAKYQAYIADLQKRSTSERQLFEQREAEVRRHVQQSTSELSEARRMFGMRESEYKLQIQTAVTRAQRATSNAEQLRAELSRMRSEAERSREEASRARHRLDLERMKCQRYEEENKRLLRQIHRMMPEYENRRSKSEYTFPGAGSSGSGTGTGYGGSYHSNFYGGRSGTASGAPMPEKTPKDELRDALHHVKRHGIEHVEDVVINVLNNSLNNITVFEAWTIVGLPMGAAGSRQKAKKLLTRFHPDRVQDEKKKESMRKRFQIINHTRGLLPEH